MVGSREVRERAVRLVRESEGSPPSRWTALVSVPCMICCAAETLRRWVREAEVDNGVRPGVPRRKRLKHAGLREIQGLSARS